MSKRTRLFSLLALSLFGCQSETTEWVLGACIEPDDFYDSCDDYCDDRFGTRSWRSDALFDDEAMGHACEVNFGNDLATSSPAVGTSAVYDDIDACEDGANAPSIVLGNEASPFYGSIRPEPAARCCCVFF